MVTFTSDLKVLGDDRLKFVDMHHHSSVSDGTTPPQVLAKIFAKRGIGLCIADHNQVKGSVYLSKHKEVFSIPSIEVTSKEAKDVLAYFYDISDLVSFWEQEIKDRIRNNRGFNLNRTSLSIHDLPDKIKAYNGVPVLAHPFGLRPKDARRLIRNEEFMRTISGVEMFTCGKATGGQIRFLKATGKPLIAGTDSHTVSRFNALTGAEAYDIDSFLSAVLKQKNVIYSRRVFYVRRMAHALAIFRKAFSLTVPGK